MALLVPHAGRGAGGGGRGRVGWGRAQTLPVCPPATRRDRMGRAPGRAARLRSADRGCGAARGASPSTRRSPSARRSFHTSSGTGRPSGAATRSSSATPCSIISDRSSSGSREWMGIRPQVRTHGPWDAADQPAAAPVRRACASPVQCRRPIVPWPYRPAPAGDRGAGTAMRHGRGPRTRFPMMASRVGAETDRALPGAGGER